MKLEEVTDLYFLQIQKKRRQVAKVQCRDIKNECPEPTCDEPELLPGRCCKTCPGDTNSKFFLVFTQVLVQLQLLLLKLPL